jgi:hypothetical protein
MILISNVYLQISLRTMPYPVFRQMSFVLQICAESANLLLPLGFIAIVVELAHGISGERESGFKVSGMAFPILHNS